MKSSIEEYRTNAEDCLRMAQAAQDDNDRPLWVTLAQSWLRLAEQADRISARIQSGEPADDNDQAGDPRIRARN
jgi:acyl transferase domain-containing protein